jgi:hypothetical protein
VADNRYIVLLPAAFQDQSAGHVRFFPDLRDNHTFCCNMNKYSWGVLISKAIKQP